MRLSRLITAFDPRNRSSDGECVSPGSPSRLSKGVSQLTSHLKSRVSSASSKAPRRAEPLIIPPYPDEQRWQYLAHMPEAASPDERWPESPAFGSTGPWAPMSPEPFTPQTPVSAATLPACFELPAEPVVLAVELDSRQFTPPPRRPRKTALDAPDPPPKVALNAPDLPPKLR